MGLLAPVERETLAAELIGIRAELVAKSAELLGYSKGLLTWMLCSLRASA